MVCRRFFSLFYAAEPPSQISAQDLVNRPSFFVSPPPFNKLKEAFFDFCFCFFLRLLSKLCTRVTDTPFYGLTLLADIPLFFLTPRQVGVMCEFLTPFHQFWISAVLAIRALAWLSFLSIFRSPSSRGNCCHMSPSGPFPLFSADACGIVVCPVSPLCVFLGFFRTVP